MKALPKGLTYSWRPSYRTSPSSFSPWSLFTGSSTMSATAVDLPFNKANTLGALLFGGLASSAYAYPSLLHHVFTERGRSFSLWGIACSQVYSYFHKFPNDPKLLKFLVGPGQLNSVHDLTICALGSRSFVKSFVKNNRICTAHFDLQSDWHIWFHSHQSRRVLVLGR